jgi:hypothetical protein
VLPKFTVLRLPIVVGSLVACSFAYDLLPSPVRAVTVVVAIAGGSAILRYWARLDGPRDEADREDSPADVVGGRHVWRVRWWVRLVAVAIPLFGIPFVLEPRLLDPEWENGMPTTELVVLVLSYAVLGRDHGGWNCCSPMAAWWSPSRFSAWAPSGPGLDG